MGRKVTRATKETMTPEEVENRHVKVVMNDGKAVCHACSNAGIYYEPWPCDAIVLAQQLRELTAQHDTLQAELAERKRRSDFCEKVVDIAVRHYEAMPRAALETHALKLNSLIAARDLEIKAVETELEKLTARHAQAGARMTWLEEGKAILDADMAPIDDVTVCGCTTTEPIQVCDYHKWLASEPKGAQQALREGEGT